MLVGARGRIPARYRNLMTLRVHALLISHVVALLQSARRSIRRTCARRGSEEEARACADRSTIPAADERAGNGTHCGADNCAPHATIDGGLLGRCATDLAARVLAAVVIVVAKLVEALAASRQHRDARPGWRNGHAGRRKERDCRDCNNVRAATLHLSWTVAA